MEHIQFLEKVSQKFSDFLDALVIYRVQLHYLFIFLIFGFLFITLFVSVQPDAICQKLIILRNFYLFAFGILNLDILYCKINRLASIYHSRHEIPLYISLSIFIIVISITVKFCFSMPELANMPITPVLSGLVFVVFYCGVYSKDSCDPYGAVSILNLLTQASLLVFIHLTYMNFSELRVRYHKLKSQLEYAMIKTEKIIKANNIQIEYLKKHFTDAIFKTFFSNNFEQNVNRNRLKEIQNTINTYFDPFHDDVMKAYFFILKYEQRFNASNIYRIFLIKMENKSLFEIIEIFQEMIDKLGANYIKAEFTTQRIKAELFKALLLDNEARYNYITKKIENCNEKIENVNKYFMYNEMYESRRVFESMTSIKEDEEMSNESDAERGASFWIGESRKSAKTSSFPDLSDQGGTASAHWRKGIGFSDSPGRKIPRNFSFESSIRLRNRPIVDIRDLEDERIQLEKYQKECEVKISEINEMKMQLDKSLKTMTLKGSIENDLKDMNLEMAKYIKLMKLYNDLEIVLKNCKSKLLKIGFSVE